jgi:predicted nucleotidyltransferase
VVPDKQISEFVTRMRAAAGANLQSIILYGSAASGDFHEKFSDVNVLCVLRDTAFPHLAQLAPTVEWWRKQNNPAPLVMTQDELQRSADVFIIELLDMQRHHRVLFGDDVIEGLTVSTAQHRVQVEYELREKVIILRQGLLSAAGNKNLLWELLLGSVPAFTTLFRHALMVLGTDAPQPRRAAVQALAEKIHFEASPFLQLLDLREGKLDRKSLDVNEVFGRYLQAVHKVTEAVDTMLEAGGRK